MDKKKNCFTLIRYFIAFKVVYSHAGICGLDLPSIKLIDWIDAVPLFFFISAYCLMLSLDNKKISFKEYMNKRFKRLYPEMWLALGLNIIILLIQFKDLVKEIGFYLWIFAQATFFQFWTPNCLRFYGVGTPNGSLWTIIVFIQFYLIIYFVHDKVKKINLKGDILLLCLFIGVNSFISIFEGNINEIIFKLILETILPYLYMFYFGIIFYKYADKLIPFCKRYFYVIFVIFILAGIYNRYLNFIPMTSNTACVLHVLICCWFFFSLAYKFDKIQIKKDYSYGIYLLHMVVMNYFIHNQIIKNDYLCYLLINIIAFILAILSSYLSKKLIKKIESVK